MLQTYELKSINNIEYICIDCNDHNVPLYLNTNNSNNFSNCKEYIEKLITF